MDPRLQRGEWADRLLLSDVVAFVGWVGLHEKVVGLVGSGPLSDGRGESGWCSDVTSTHGAWRHAGVRFLLSGVLGDVDIGKISLRGVEGCPAHSQ